MLTLLNLITFIFCTLTLVLATTYSFSIRHQSIKWAREHAHPSTRNGQAR